MLYQYLQPAVAESVWCSHYWIMLVEHNPVERYKPGFIHNLLKYAESISLKQIQWTGGLYLQ